MGFSCGKGEGSGEGGGWRQAKEPELTLQFLPNARLFQRHPLLRAMGFLVSKHDQLVAIPPLPFLSLSPLGEHAKWRCDTPSQKGYLSDPCAIPHKNKAKWVRCSLCDTISKGIVRYGGVSRTAAKDGHRFHPLIGDYGLACCDRSEGCGELGRCTGSAGTPGYVSPAVVAGKSATPEDDLWSMGKVLLQIIHNTNLMVDTSAETDVPFPKYYSGLDAYYRNLFKHLGSPRLGQLRSETRERIVNYQGVGPLLPLMELLNYLLCTGCDRGDENLGHKMTSHAMTLTKAWLKELGVKPVVPDMVQERPKLDEIKSCIADPFHRAHRAGSN